jgi:hypothetical protein
MASEIKVDTISEKTSAGGVTIDGLLIKDGGISGDVSLIGTTPTFTIGDAGAEDAALVFDGNAQDFYIGLDDSADDLIIGLGSTVGTTPAISINEDRDVTISDGAIDFDIASHDTSNGLKLGGTLVTATAAELNIMDGVTATAAEINLIDGGTARGTTAIADGDGILINDAGTMRMTTVQTVKTYMGTTFNGIDDTSSSFDDCVTITDNEVVINEDGDNQDFRVESDDQANFFFCDASANIAGFSLHDRPDLGFIHITTASSGVSSVDAAGDELILEGSGHTGMSIFSGTSSTGGIYFGDSGDDNIGGIRYDHSDNDMYFTVEASDIARFSGGKGMRVGDAGTVDTSLQVVGSDDDSTGSLRLNGNARINMTNAADRDIIIFGNSAGSVRGKISIDVDGGVTYHTSSDYRLKENVVDLTDAITRLKTLKPRRFKWLNRPETIDGFLAHEVTAVPEAVSGTKDGMADKLRVVLDKDGNFLAEGVQDGNHEKGIAIGEYPSDSTYHATKEYPDYQQMDNSKLVPLLTASLQEAITKIETLETEMTALKARVTTLEG